MSGNEIRFVDTTLRDGHLSLWASGMTTAMVLPVAERLGRAGFEAIEVMKVFSAVRAGVNGVIEEILIENAGAIEYGQALFLVRPDEPAAGSKQ